MNRVTEADIKGIYEGFYKVAQQIGSSSYTEMVKRLVRQMVTNPGIASYEHFNRNPELSKLLAKIDEEYAKRFRDLEFSQARGENLK